MAPAGGPRSCFYSPSPLLTPPPDLRFGVSGDPLTGYVEVGQLTSLSGFPACEGLGERGHYNGWQGPGAGRAGGEPAAQVALLEGPGLEACSLDPALHRGPARCGTPGARGGVLGVPSLALSSLCPRGSWGLLPLSALWPPSLGSLIRAGKLSCQASPPPCLADPMWTCSCLRLGRGCRIPPGWGLPCRPGPLSRTRLEAALAL